MINNVTLTTIEIKDFIHRVERLNNRTENKLKDLRNLLIEYQSFREEKIRIIKPSTYQVVDLIDRADMYLNRKRLGKKTENYVFKEIKEITLIRFNNTLGCFS